MTSSTSTSMRCRCKFCRSRTCTVRCLNPRRTLVAGPLIWLLLHSWDFYHISDLFEGSLVHSIAGFELLNSREKEDWERAYEQSPQARYACRRCHLPNVEGQALLTAAKCAAAPDLIESVRARTDYTEEEKINLEEMINRTEFSPSPLLSTSIYPDDQNIRALRSISLLQTGQAARRRNWPT